MHTSITDREGSTSTQTKPDTQTEQIPLPLMSLLQQTIIIQQQVEQRIQELSQLAKSGGGSN